jgi:hypothetical protein
LLERKRDIDPLTDRQRLRRDRHLAEARREPCRAIEGQDKAIAQPIDGEDRRRRFGQAGRLNGEHQREITEARERVAKVDRAMGTTRDGMLRDRHLRKFDREFFLANAGAGGVGISADHPDQLGFHRSASRIGKLERDRLTGTYRQPVRITRQFQHIGLAACH